MCTLTSNICFLHCAQNMLSFTIIKLSLVKGGPPTIFNNSRLLLVPTGISLIAPFFLDGFHTVDGVTIGPNGKFTLFSFSKCNVTLCLIYLQ